MAVSRLHGRLPPLRREEPGRVDVGGRAQQVEAVGPRRVHHRAVIGVEKRVVAGQSAEHRQLGLFVVADRELVTGDLGRQPAVALAVVEVLDHALPGVVGVLVAAGLGVGSRVRSSGTCRPCSRGSSARPACRWLPGTSRADGRTSGSPSSVRRRCRTEPSTGRRCLRCLPPSEVSRPTAMATGWRSSPNCSNRRRPWPAAPPIRPLRP